MLRRMLGATMVVLMLTLVSASAAMASSGYEVFKQCPVGASRVNGCIYSPTESGYIKIGSHEVPIVNTQVLQGGLLREEEAGIKHFVAALNGETLTKTAQKVPGGLAGLVECNKVKNIVLRLTCEVTFENGVTGVNATTELAAPASSVVLKEIAEQTGQGTALTLPVKIKLENPLLGGECYLGSNSDPIGLELTTGATTGGPTGNPGKISTKEEGGILVISGVSLVSNTFVVPGADGCGLLGILDPIIDLKMGLPSGSGHNTAVLSGKTEIANSELVEEAGF